ncbi:MAG: hypothetical protein KDA22_04305 [Phycisphaerales bacterium]|nr:hypothetical protein [Phycisphaerales bacterium]
MAARLEADRSLLDVGETDGHTALVDDAAAERTADDEGTGAHRGEHGVAVRAVEPRLHARIERTELGDRLAGLVDQHLALRLRLGRGLASGEAETGGADRGEEDGGKRTSHVSVSWS